MATCPTTAPTSGTAKDATAKARNDPRAAAALRLNAPDAQIPQYQPRALAMARGLPEAPASGVLITTRKAAGLAMNHTIKKVPTRTGPRCAPSACNPC